MPKSVIFTRPSTRSPRPMRMLAGFTSRCTIPAACRPGAVSGRVMAGFRGGGSRSGGSDGRRDPEPPLVLLLGAGRQGVVERAELVQRLGGEVVEDALPGRRLVIAAGEQQLPR